MKRFDSKIIKFVYLKVLDGKVNLTIGGPVLTKARATFLTPSIPILRTSILFVFKETNIYGYSVIRLLALFEPYVWLTLGVILIIVTIILLWTKKLTQETRHFLIGGRLNRTPILNMWGSTLGYANSNPLMTNIQFFSTFARTLTTFWVILWLVVRSSYQSGLYKYLQGYRYISPYDTIEKVLNSEATIVVYPILHAVSQHLFKKHR